MMQDLTQADLNLVSAIVPKLDWQLQNTDDDRAQIIVAVMQPGRLDIRLEKEQTALGWNYLCYTTNTLHDGCSEYQRDDWADSLYLDRAINEGVWQIKHYHQSILDSLS